jgi:hypothetical protein
MARPRTRPDTLTVQHDRQRDTNRYYDTDPFDGWAKTALNNARRRARLKGLACTITVEDVKQAAKHVTHCPISGVELLYARGYGLRANSASIDRFDNTSDYTPETIAVISMRANAIKGNCSIDEMIAIGDYAKLRKL